MGYKKMDTVYFDNFWNRKYTTTVLTSSQDEILHYLPLDMIKLCNKVVPCHIGVCPWAVV